MWNGEQWVNLVPPGSPAVLVFVSASPPQPPLLEGSFWLDTINLSLYIWVTNLAGDEWVQVTGTTPEDPLVPVSISPPTNPSEGALWYNPASSELKIWVETDLPVGWRLIQGGDSPDSRQCVSVSTTPPTNPEIGDLWYNPLTKALKVRVGSLTGEVWEEVSTQATSQKPTVSISATPPANPKAGDLWWKPIGSGGELKVWYGSPQNKWVLVNSTGGSSGQAPVYVSVTEPANPKNHYLWYNPVSQELRVREGIIWEVVSTTSEPTQPPSSVSVSPPPNPTEGDLWFNPINGSLSVWYEDIDGGQWVSASVQGPQGIQGPPGPPPENIGDIGDVDDSARVNKSVLYFDFAQSKWKGDDVNTLISITDGGNF